MRFPAMLCGFGSLGETSHGRFHRIRCVSHPDMCDIPCRLDIVSLDSSLQAKSMPASEKMLAYFFPPDRCARNTPSSKHRHTEIFNLVRLSTNINIQPTKTFNLIRYSTHTNIQPAKIFVYEAFCAA